MARAGPLSFSVGWVRFRPAWRQNASRPRAIISPRVLRHVQAQPVSRRNINRVPILKRHTGAQFLPRTMPADAIVMGTKTGRASGQGRNPRIRAHRFPSVTIHRFSYLAQQRPHPVVIAWPPRLFPSISIRRITFPTILPCASRERAYRGTDTQRVLRARTLLILLRLRDSPWPKIHSFLRSLGEN